LIFPKILFFDSAPCPPLKTDWVGVTE